MLVEHVGSAHTDAELGILLERARRIAAGGQEVLDFEVPPAPVARSLMSPTGVPVSCSRPPAAAGRAAAGRAARAATSSRLLYDVIGAVYDRLGFDVVDDAVFRDLVIARIVEPTSKADSMRVLTDLGANAVSYRTIQRHLAEIGTGRYRDADRRRSASRTPPTGAG